MHILSEAFLDILNGVTQPPPAPALPPPDPTSIPTQIEPIPSTRPQTDSDQVLPSSHPQSFPIPCINLHPALPGAFDGANAVGRAYEAFARGEIQNTGVMVHRVVKEVDRGEPIVIRQLRMEHNETLHDLEERIHQVRSSDCVFRDSDIELPYSWTDQIEHDIIVEGARIVLEDLEKMGSS